MGFKEATASNGSCKMGQPLNAVKIHGDGHYTGLCTSPVYWIRALLTDIMHCEIGDRLS